MAEIDNGIQEPDETQDDVVQSAPALGVSTRGRATPRGTDLSVSNSLLLATPQGERASQQAYQQGRRDALDRQNSALEAKFRGSRARFYKDPESGLYTQEVETETGKPLFHETTWEPGAIHPKTKAPAYVKRNQYGEQEFKHAPIVRGSDPTDDQLYYHFKETDEQIPAGKLTDLMNHPEPQVARMAHVANMQRTKAIWDEALQPHKESLQKAEADLRDARDTAAAYGSEIAALQKQQETAADPTIAAGLQASIDQLANDQQSLIQRTGKTGDLSLAHRRAQTAFGIFSAKARAAEYEARRGARIAVLKENGLPTEGDPQLAEIDAAQAAVNQAFNDHVGEHLESVAGKLAQQDQQTAALTAGEPKALLQRGLKNVGGISVEDVIRRYGNFQGEPPAAAVLKVHQRLGELEQMLADPEWATPKTAKALQDEQTYLGQLYDQRVARMSPAAKERLQATIDAQTTSTMGAVGRAAGMGLAPAAGAWGGAESGAALGSVVGPVGTVVGGGLGALIGGILANKAQSRALEKLAPEAHKQLVELQVIDSEQHPFASTSGGLLASVPIFEIQGPLAAAKGLASLFKLAKGETVNAAEMLAAKATAIQSGLGAGLGLVGPMIEGQAPTVKDVTQSVAQVMMFGAPRFGGKGGAAQPGKPGAQPATETPPTSAGGTPAPILPEPPPPVKSAKEAAWEMAMREGEEPVKRETIKSSGGDEAPFAEHVARADQVVRKSPIGGELISQQLDTEANANRLGAKPAQIPAQAQHGSSAEERLPHTQEVAGSNPVHATIPAPQATVGPGGEIKAPVAPAEQPLRPSGEQAPAPRAEPALPIQPSAPTAPAAAEPISTTLPEPVGGSRVGQGVNETAKQQAPASVDLGPMEMPFQEKSSTHPDLRIREDLPEAKPIIDKIDEIVKRGTDRQAAMSDGQVKQLTHPFDTLTSAEKEELHNLKMQLRPKSAQEARADILKKRADRKAQTESRQPERLPLEPAPERSPMERATQEAIERTKNLDFAERRNQAEALNVIRKIAAKHGVSAAELNRAVVYRPEKPAPEVSSKTETTPAPVVAEENKPISIQPTEAPNALQKPSASSLLQRPQEGTGKAGGERQRVEQGEQGKAAPEARPAEPAKPAQENPPPVQQEVTNELPTPAQMKPAELRAELAASGIKTVSGGVPIEEARSNQLKAAVGKLRQGKEVSSLAEAKTGSIKIEDAQAAVAEWKAKNTKAPEIEVVNDPEWTENGRGVRGQYRDGKLVINSAYADSAATIHEIANHEWAHDTLASKQGKLALAAFATRELPVADLDALKAKYPQQAGESVVDHRMRLVEEWAAKNAEKNPSVWRKIVDAVRGWLADRGLVTLTHDEAARAMLRTLRGGMDESAFNDYADARSSLGGYADDFSKSNRAIDAEANGRFPASEIARKLGLPTKFITDHAPNTGEWHHTSKFYNTTDYYDLQQVKDWLHGEGDYAEGGERAEARTGNDVLAEWKNKQKEISVKPSDIAKGVSVKYLEWSGSRNHPVATERIEHNVTVERKPGQKFLTITRPDGTSFKKAPTTRGFEIAESKEGKFAPADYDWHLNKILGVEPKDIPRSSLADTEKELRAGQAKLASAWSKMRSDADLKRTLAADRDAVDTKANQYSREVRNTVFDQLKRSIPDTKELATAQDALAFHIEAGGSAKKLQEFRAKIEASTKAAPKWKARALAAINYASANGAKLSDTAATYRKFTDEQVAREQEAGLPTLKRDNYVPRYQDIEEGSWFDTGAHTSPTGASNRKNRKYETLADSIADGVDPKTLNAVDVLDTRIRSGETGINVRTWQKSLKDYKTPSGEALAQTPTRVSRADGSFYYEPGKGYVLENVGNTPIAVKKEFAGMVGALTDPSWFSQSAARQTAQRLNASAKSITLAVDTFHLGRLAFRSAMIRAASLKDAKFGPAFREGLLIAEHSPAEIERMGKSGEIPAETVPAILESKLILQKGIDVGYQSGRVADAMHQEMIQKVPLLGDVNKFIFQKFQRGAMNDAFVIEYKRQRADYPQMTDEQVARKVSRELMTRFGNLGRQGWFTSKTAQDMARMIFLAPEWNQGLIRSEIGAVTDIAKTAANKLIGRQAAMGLLGREMVTTAIALFAGSQIINQATRGKFTWENPEESFGAKISAWIPDKLGGSNGFFFNPLGLTAETAHLMMNAYERTGNTYEPIVSYVRSRASATTRPAWTLATGKDALGRTIKEGERWQETAKDTIPAPISGGAIIRGASGVVQGGMSEKFPGEYQKQAMQTFGMRTELAPSPEKRIRILASEFNEARGKVQQGEFGVSEYAELTDALRRQNKGDIEDAIATLSEKHDSKAIEDYYRRWQHTNFTGSAVSEAQFLRTLNAEQRKQYQAARQERTRIAVRALQAIRSLPVGTRKPIAAK